jgi:putative redox protein
LRQSWLSFIEGQGFIMEITVKTLDHFKFAIQSSTHSIICDQPVENGGEDAGMSPPEFLLASLGSCAQFYALQYLRARKLDDNGVQVTVSAEKLKQPARLGKFVIQVTCPTELTEEQTEGLRRSVHLCLIHNTLLSQPEIHIELTVGEPALR